MTSSCRIEPLDLTERATDLQAFYERLGEEKEHFALPLDLVLTSYRCYALLDEQGTILGLSGLRKKWGCSIFYVVVSESMQGKGWGKQLTQLCLDKKYVFFPLLLTVHKKNHAQHLYKKLGMITIGDLKNDWLMIQAVGCWRMLGFLARFWIKDQ